MQMGQLIQKSFYCSVILKIQYTLHLFLSMANIVLSVSTPQICDKKGTRTVLLAFENIFTDTIRVRISDFCRLRQDIFHAFKRNWLG